jgi:lysophosphatidylcholine acyltransferase/lyso-PAF acetyltransferase
VIILCCDVRLLTIYLTICQFNNSVDIEYLPVYTPSDIERDNPCLFAENVRTLLSE